MNIYSPTEQEIEEARAHVPEPSQTTSEVYFVARRLQLTSKDFLDYFENPPKNILHRPTPRITFVKKLIDIDGNSFWAWTIGNRIYF